MDCPACKGNGEIDLYKVNEELELPMYDVENGAQHRPSWPYTCLVCGGSGILETH